ncbi:Pimeloyl-(acyl-carrier protein) methyl ester esterase [Luteimicrobium xylanilyticum]|uniref:Pimeloyl-(Acyl-carrier protein) methyl ester esterase n=1 Tax=Luteimicrobium xylanilyticum TaxID=1133546 RepID=A0A5P9QBV8_9MICO|nr:Pimeloyl-(acyl-carrier protein) methyl ester esterase [Luteimicrobium xylanilyticum]
MTPSSLTRSVPWRGRTVAWDRFGSGPPLVLLHGTPWSSALWRPVATALAQEFTVHLWDMPGCGASSKEPSHAVDLGVQGELFADLLDLWELERPHVVAHDIGGAVALRGTVRTGSRGRCRTPRSRWWRAPATSSSSTPRRRSPPISADGCATSRGERAGSHQRPLRGRGWQRGHVNDERFMKASRRTGVPHRGHGRPSWP